MRAALLFSSAVVLAFSLPGAAGAADEEETRLVRLKDDECAQLERRLAEAAGEQRFSVLLQLARNGTPRAVLVIERELETAYDRPTLLNAVAGIGRPHAAPLLLRAARSKDPGARLHALERLHVALGKDALPHLRSFEKEEPEERVRRAIRKELVGLKDEAAIAELRREIAGVEVETREGAERGIQLLSEALDSHCSEAADEVGRLLRRADWKRSDVHRQLVQYAAGTALWLGHRESVRRVIELLEDPGSARFDYPGLHSLEHVLRRYTREEHRSAAEWIAWWEKEGKDLGLFSSFVPPEDEIAITNAVVAWGRSEASRRFIKTEVVYLETGSKYIEGRAGLWKGLDQGIRVYTPDEVTLLGVRPYSVDSVESDGRRAIAVIGDGAFRSSWRRQEVKLLKSEGRWRVVGR